jgi:hypothetical protein
MSVKNPGTVPLLALAGFFLAAPLIAPIALVSLVYIGVKVANGYNSTKPTPHAENEEHEE